MPAAKLLAYAAQLPQIRPRREENHEPEQHNQQIQHDKPEKMDRRTSPPVETTGWQQVGLEGS